MMRCPLCRTPVSWVPRWDGKRFAVASNQDPEGEYYLDANGVLRLVPEGLADDIPRYRGHNPCPKATP